MNAEDDREFDDVNKVQNVGTAVPSLENGTSPEGEDPTQDVNIAPDSDTSLGYKPVEVSDPQQESDILPDGLLSSEGNALSEDGTASEDNVEATNPLEALIDKLGAMLSPIRRHHVEFTQADERSQKALYQMLGHIRVSAAVIDADESLKSLLVQQLLNDTDIPMKWRKSAFGKPASEILVVMVTGVNKQTAPKKSQYLKALSIADEKEIENSVEAFVAWIQKVGGVIGCRKLGKRPDKRPDKKQTELTLEETIEQMEEEVESLDQPIRLNLPHSLKYEAGYALIMVKKDREDDAPMPIFVAQVDDKDIIKRAAERVTELQYITRKSRWTTPSSVRSKKPHRSFMENARDRWRLADRYDKDITRFQGFT